MGTLAAGTGTGTDSMESLTTVRGHTSRLRCDGTCETFEIPEIEEARQALPGAGEAQWDA